ncbi:MAG TPA: DUF485 domain-containing protein [Arenimonas sp.]|nr:DUF485 domain-containing protein [Arenimonas sp.]
MYDPTHALIHANPKFQLLVRKRERLAWLLSIIMFGLYLLFILLIAFKPALLGARIFVDSPVTWGIPFGIGLILAAFILTGIYVWRANSEFDRINQEILDEVNSK